MISHFKFVFQYCQNNFDILDDEKFFVIALLTSLYQKPGQRPSDAFLGLDKLIFQKMGMSGN